MNRPWPSTAKHKPVSVADLRDRLSDTRLPDDPTDVMLPASAERWPEDMIEALTASLKPAGVLIPVRQIRGQLSVLLTRRSAELKHHAGQISFPGGRMEPDDSDIGVTALRETHEEVGIAPSSVSVLGHLEPMPTITGYAVTATIGLVAEGTMIEVDRSEVELAFDVPLDFLLDPANAKQGERTYNGRVIPIVEFQYAEHRIWGATANMLLELQKKLIK